jgi:Fe-S cluster biogenesis protein NfuA
VTNATEFQQRVQQLGKLIAELEQMPDNPLKATAGELVQLLMEVHGAGIERMMEIVFESKHAGANTIARLGNDTIVRSLLLLYSIHPEDLETRVQKSLDALRPRLRKFNCTAELIEINEGAVHLRIKLSGHACGSTTENLRREVEESVYEYAPDITSLTILGIEDRPSSGFVALESLAGPPVAHTVQPASNVAVVGGAD